MIALEIFLPHLSHFAVNNILNVKWKSGLTDLPKWEGLPWTAANWEPQKTFVRHTHINPVFRRFWETKRLPHLIKVSERRSQ